MKETIYPHRLNLLWRDRKRGIGTAYIDGFMWGLEREYQLFVEMDADLEKARNSKVSNYKPWNPWPLESLDPLLRLNWRRT
jgi:hypothetical protein